MQRTRRDRGALLTRTLLGLGLALLTIVVLVLVLRPPHGRRAAPPATSTAPPPATSTAPPPATSTAPPPAPAAPPIAAASVSPFAATIEWRTDEPTTGRVSVAVGGGTPALWSEPSGPSRDHRVTLSGLAPATDYRFSAGNRTIDVHTPAAPGPVAASTAGGAILLDGAPFFPLLVWGECPSIYGDLLNAGIDLLAQDPCGGADEQVAALAGRALSAGVVGDPGEANPALIGWFYPDEADARRLTANTLPAPPPGAGRLAFLTLSNHFYSQAAPLAWGRSMYPGLVARADVVGFDLYPLQNWCQRDGFDHVYRAQLELERLAGAKPTFQWIEASTMECGDRPGLAITPRTIRLESVLALAAGAHGLGFFPGSWTAANAGAVAGIASAVKAAGPALLRPTLAVEAPAPLRASARELYGALYLVLANPTRKAVRATLHVDGAGDRLFTPLLSPGEPLQATHDVLHLYVPPLDAGIYVAAP